MSGPVSLVRGTHRAAPPEPPVRGARRGLSRGLLGLALLALTPFLGAAPLRADELPPPTGTHPAISAEDLTARIRWLASDALGGRMSVEPGGLRASKYVADEFARLGLEPVGDDGGWFQGFEIPYPLLGPGNLLAARLGDGIEVPVEERTFAVETDWNPMSVSPSAKTSGPLVFAGYGVVRPEKAYDDYAKLDVKGKVVLVLRREPPWGGGPSQHATFLAKLNEAASRGASALLVVNDAKTAAARDMLMHWTAPVGAAGSSALVPYVFVSRLTAEALVAPLERSLDALQTAIDAAPGGPKPASAQVPDVHVRLQVDVQRATGKNARNVAGLLRGRDPALRDEVVVLGAHHDHVGRGFFGSAGGPGAEGRIHPGADDNASGTALLLEVAETMAAAPERPRRSVLFLSFSGEELGLLGSRHYVEHPLLPLDKTVAMVNCDMVGRYDPKRTLQIGGVGTGEGLQALCDELARPYGLVLSWDPQGVAPSDNTSFFVKKIPVLFFFTGIHDEYHTPADTWDRIDYADEAKIASLSLDVTRALADRDARVAFTKPPRPTGGRAMLGVGPAPGSDTGGVVVADVADGGPADEAGMKPGDVITALGALVVKDLRDLQKALNAQKPGDVVIVKVLREGVEKALHVTLGSR